MGLADDMGRLRREIEELRGARRALSKRLSRYASELRHSSHEKRAAIHRANADQAAKTKAALSSFVSGCRRTVGNLVGNFQRERSAARRGWSGTARATSWAPAEPGESSDSEQRRRRGRAGGTAPLSSES